ncbi:MAG: hypothetical protein QOI13_757, partial [Paraburkholderia sp.]|nr:hypothetical protein [Paraburkholderia sp.]
FKKRRLIMIELDINVPKKEASQHLMPRIHAIEPHSYESYIKDASNLAGVSPDISRITNELINDKPKSVANRLFARLLDEIESDLSNPQIGIAAVDIPESSSYNLTDNAFWGVALSLALGSNIFSLGQDRINSTPYTAYAASYRKSKGLTDLGLQPVAPETKLGFHTDGVLIGDKVSMPINIMLYNVSIEYRKPGNFYWVPFSMWAERDAYVKRVGLDRIYNIKVTPSVYEIDENHLEIVSPQQVTAPIFVSTESFGVTIYLNGDVIYDSDFDLSTIEDLRCSLAANGIRFSVPQKTRRLIFVRNVLGAHARDIFEEPNSDAPFTRIFLRSVDDNCIELNSRSVTKSGDQ